jgi:hypothetical protein
MTIHRSRRERAVAWVAGLVLAPMVGCGDANRPKVVPVTGTVTFQGKPLDGAQVTFRAQEGRQSAGELAFGTTDAQGRFLLRTVFGPTTSLDGAVPGDYRVFISKLIPPGGMSEEAYQQKLEAEKRAGENGVYGAPRETVPPRVESLSPSYSDAQQTKLAASVKKGEKNDFKFEVQ